MKHAFNTLLVFGFLLVAGTNIAVGQLLDISSGGTPTITGALGGSVTGSSSVLNNLVVTINFGEVSPLNTSNIVKVVVPIAVRSRQPYQVNALVSMTNNANVQAIQRSDIGIGFNNMRAMGSGSQLCTNSSHMFYSPFNNDPAANVSINAAGRAAYPSTLNNISVSTTVLSGPRLQRNNNNTRQTNDGYIFDAILAITPQFYTAGSSSAVVTFTISAGPNVPC